MKRHMWKTAAVIAAAGIPAFAQTDTAPDYDGSGNLDTADLMILQGHIARGDLAGDLDSSGDVDSFDLVAFLSLAKDPNALAGEAVAIDWSEMPRDGELRLGGAGVVSALALDSGVVLHFVELEPGVVAVLEEAPEGARGLDSVPSLGPDSSAAEVFFALSPAGTPVPDRLVRDDQSVDDLGGPARVQGWARASMIGDSDGGDDDILNGYSNCNDANFKNYINSFNYNDRGTPTFRLNKVPDSTSLFDKYDYIPGDGKAYTFYEYFVGGDAGSRWFDIDRYISRVSVCAIDYSEPENPYGLAHPPISYQGYSNNHMGPVVRMMYRRPGESTWSLATVKDFAAGEVGKRLTWHFYTGSNWDWRTDIYWAGGDDKFDIGHAVEDN